jgi:Mn2+/Fe2+ NRAMP family transporter
MDEHTGPVSRTTDVDLQSGDHSRAHLPRLGAGLISGAADDDPSGIATYSQAGAQFGYALTWTMPFTFVLLACVQEISGRLGLVTGSGLAANLRVHYPRPLLLSMVGLLTFANIINLGADLGAMSEALVLLFGGPGHLYVVAFGVACSATMIKVPYLAYVRILKWLTLGLFAYVAAAFIVQVPWGTVILRALLPEVTFTREYLIGLVAIFCTTLSPYLIFWQAAQEAEDLRSSGRPPLRERRGDWDHDIRRVRIDSYVGIGFSNLIGLFIIVTAAATLREAGITEIQTAAQAAEALRPIAGPFAFLAFAIGLIGTGLLAVPVLAGSTAYAVAEAAGWPVGLSLLPTKGIAFYGVVAMATLLGVGAHFAPIAPMRLLYWSAVLNGIIVVPIMAVLLLVTSRQEVMGNFVLPMPLRLAGWAVTLIMAFVVATMFIMA